MGNQLRLFDPPPPEDASRAVGGAAFEELSLPEFAAPSKTDEGVPPGGGHQSADFEALLPRELGGVVSSTFRRIEVAEGEIKNAKHWHPRRHKELNVSFGMLVPTQPLRGLSDDLYRAHCRELLDRAAIGESDLRLGTAAEVVGALASASLEAPPTRVATLLYEELFASLFPGQARSVLGSERVARADPFEKTAIRELEAALRRKLATDRAIRRDRVRESAESYGVVIGDAVPAASSRVIPIREVVVRYRGPRFAASDRIGTPENAVRFASRVIQDDAREHFLAIHLDARHQAIGHQVVSVGTATASLVHPREVFQPAVAQPRGSGDHAAAMSGRPASGDPSSRSHRLGPASALRLAPRGGRDSALLQWGNRGLEQRSLSRPDLRRIGARSRQQRGSRLL
jgi:hypothetical protein